MPQNKITPINIDPLFTTPLNYERMLGNNSSINQPNITPRNQNAIRTAGMILTNSKAPETATSQIKIPGLPELESETESMPQDDSQSRFLASLLSQGAGMFGAALQGENVLKAGQVFESNRDYQNKLNEQKKQIESLTNPESDVSKRKRLVYERALGIKIPGEFSASDLEDRNVLQGLVAQSQPKPVPGRVSGGVSQPKEEKEIKSNQKSMAEYRDHVASLAEMGNVLDKIKLLNRTRIGQITPDISVDTQAYSSSLDRAAQPMIKTLAGPGTLQKEERDTYGKLVPTGNTRADLALRQANDIIVDGTNRALSLMNADLNTGNISRKDYDALINEYNEQLSKKGIGINQIINPSTGRLETRQKKEVTLKDGKQVIVDQFGYTWE